MKKFQLQHENTRSESNTADPYGNCRAVNTFEKINRIGEGTYGTVYRAIDKLTQKMVALKRIIFHGEKNDGFPVTSLREINALRRCSNHPNCVELLDVVVGKSRDSVFLVFEYCEHDLANLVRNFNQPFSESEIKSVILQILSALTFLHQNDIIHRDLKLSNLLYNNRGVLKVADFGLARNYSSSLSQMTQTVVTLWYRAPELLLGATMYCTGIDLWALGCIFGELLLHKPLMPGNNELDQVMYVFNTLGCPTELIWRGLLTMPAIVNNSIDLQKEQQRHPYNNLPSILPELGPTGLSLLNRLLAYDPTKRATAAQAWEHPYFSSPPLPRQLQFMPTFPSAHGEGRAVLQKRKAVSASTVPADDTALLNAAAAALGSQPKQCRR